MKLGYLLLAFALAVITVVSLAGFRGHKFSRPPFEIFPDMNYQEKVKDQVPSAFFSDGMGARAPIAGTVPEEMPGQNDYWATGKWDETHWGDGIPVHDAKEGGRPLQIDAENMARGRERYTISCEVCHGAVGDGKGITSQYGLNGAASYQTDRLRKDSAGDIFNTITNGKGQMLGYGYNIAIDDRWRIVMYIRALQLSQNAAYGDASTDEQAALDKAKKPAAPPAPAQPETTPGVAPAPTAPNPPQPGQPTGPTAPAPAGTPSPTVPPPNQPGEPKPPGTTMNSSPLRAPREILIKGIDGEERVTYSDEDGHVLAVETTHYTAHFAKPAQQASSFTSTSPEVASSHSTPPVEYLAQETMIGWIDIYSDNQF